MTVFSHNAFKQGSSKIFSHGAKFAAAATTTYFNPMMTACDGSDDESDEDRDRSSHWRKSTAEPRVLTYGIGGARMKAPPIKTDAYDKYHSIADPLIGYTSNTAIILYDSDDEEEGCSFATAIKLYDSEDDANAKPKAKGKPSKAPAINISPTTSIRLSRPFQKISTPKIVNTSIGPSTPDMYPPTTMTIINRPVNPASLRKGDCLEALTTALTMECSAHEAASTAPIELKNPPTHPIVSPKLRHPMPIKRPIVNPYLRPKMQIQWPTSNPYLRPPGSHQSIAVSSASPSVAKTTNPYVTKLPSVTPVFPRTNLSPQAVTGVDEARSELARVVGRSDFEFEGIDQDINEKTKTSSIITKRHKNRKDNLDLKFRDVLLSDSRLSPLAAWMRGSNGEILKDIEGNPLYHFYDICKGDRSDEKRVILNKCMLKFFFTEGYKKDGELMQPNGFATKIRTLFSTFHQRGILYSATEDFKFTGGFGSYVSSIWQDENQDDVTFGNRPSKSGLPENLNDLVRQKLNLELALPPTKREMDMDDPMFLYMMFFFALSTKLLFRGQQEFKDLKFGHLVEGTYNSRASGNLSGLEYLQVDGLSDKTSKKTLANHTTFNAAHKRRCADFPTDILSPLKWLKRIKTISGPGQVYVFCSPATKTRLNLNKLGVQQKLIGFHSNMLLDPEKPMSTKKIASFGPLLCNYLKIPVSGNHEFRALGISNANDTPLANPLPSLGQARHQRPDSQLPYQRPTKKSDEIFQMAINGIDPSYGGGSKIAASSNNSSIPKSKSSKVPTKKDRELKKIAAYNYAVTIDEYSKPTATKNKSSSELSCLRKSKRLNTKKTE